jgi:hypothetical protein
LSVLHGCTNGKFSDYPDCPVENCQLDPEPVGARADIRSMRNPIVWPRSFSPQRPHLFRPMSADPAGVSGPTPQAVRGARYRRTSRGRYLPATVQGRVPEQRIVEAAEVLPEFGGVTGWAALRWYGARWLDGCHASGELRRVTLATGYCDILGQRGIHVSQERLGPDELDVVDGLRVTTAVRSLFFAMRYARDVREAVRIADLSAYDDVVSTSEITAYALAHPGWTGVPQCREALVLTDENAWSPREVDVRLCWTLDAGLPRPLTNAPVFDRAGRHLGTPDLLDPEAGLAIEYDGAVHLDPMRRRADVGRVERFREAGIEVLVVMAGEGRDWMVVRMCSARKRARFEAESSRLWTTRVPPWWVSTTTVAARRSLTGEIRGRVLGYRDLAG